MASSPVRHDSAKICSILRGDQKSNFNLKLWGKTRNINRGKRQSCDCFWGELRLFYRDIGQFHSNPIFDISKTLIVDSDPVEKLCQRICLILEKDLKRQKSSKKLKTENGEAVPAPVVPDVPVPILMSNGEPIDASTSIEDALRLKDLTLSVGPDEVFNCIINPPRIKDLTLTTQPMAGYTVYADAISADAKAITYKWFVGSDQEIDENYM